MYFNTTAGLIRVWRGKKRPQMPSTSWRHHICGVLVASVGLLFADSKIHRIKTAKGASSKRFFSRLGCVQSPGVLRPLMLLGKHTFLHPHNLQMSRGSFKFVYLGWNLKISIITIFFFICIIQHEVFVWILTELSHEVLVKERQQTSSTFFFPQQQNTAY